MKVCILVTCILVFYWLAIGTALSEQIVPKVIDFDGAVNGGDSSNIYQSIFTGPIKFLHSKHVEDYGAGCGECHHDGDYEPIESFDPDETYACIECHDEEGLIRGPISENKASESDFIAHRSNVLHIQCIGCHKQFNNSKKVVRAPESCIACHSKHPQGWMIK